MEYSNNNSMAETPQENWIDWFKSVQFFAVALIIPLWKLIDKYFEYQSKKDRDFIKSVVQEAISGEMSQVREDIKELKTTIDNDRKENSKEIKELTKQVYNRNQ